MRVSEHAVAGNVLDCSFSDTAKSHRVKFRHDQISKHMHYSYELNVVTSRRTMIAISPVSMRERAST